MVRVDAALPHLDAALTSYRLVASWWGARKHTANWWLWIAVDTIYIGEYLYKRPVGHSLALPAACDSGGGGPGGLAASGPGLGERILGDPASRIPALATKTKTWRMCAPMALRHE